MKNLIPIDDFNDTRIHLFHNLSETQLLRYYEPQPGLFLTESPKVIARALDAGYEPIAALVDIAECKGDVLEIFERLNNIPIYVATTEVLNELQGFALTRGMLCAMKRRSMPDYTDILTNTRRVAVMEDVVNPTNVGAIFRSAAALNMDAILLTPACSDPLYRRAARVSMGTVFQAPWTYLPYGPENSEQNYIHLLQQQGYKTVAFALRNDSINIDDPKLLAEEKLAIIMGTEGEGLADSTLQACDYTVKIPMSHDVDSLNVAAASAIAFWELGKK